MRVDTSSKTWVEILFLGILYWIENKSGTDGRSGRPANLFKLDLVSWPAKAYSSYSLPIYEFKYATAIESIRAWVFELNYCIILGSIFFMNGVKNRIRLIRLTRLSGADTIRQLVLHPGLHSFVK